LFTNTAEATFTGGPCRIYVFQWHNDNTIRVPLNSDLFTTATSGNYDATSQPKVDNVAGKLFTMLYDKVHNFGELTTTLPAMQHFKVPLKYCRKRVQYSNGATTGYDQIYIGAIASIASAANDNVFWSFQARCHYEDA